MIDIRVTTVGDKEIAESLLRQDSATKAALRLELADVGSEIVSIAQGRAPRRTGIMASKIRWYFGSEVTRTAWVQQGTVRVAQKYRTTKDIKWKDGRIVMTVRPFGRVAHLMENGVNARFQQRAGRGSGAGKVTASIAKFHTPKWSESRTLTYQRSLLIRPRPFFTPAVMSVSGTVFQRLQKALDSVAAAAQAGDI